MLSSVSTAKDMASSSSTPAEVAVPGGARLAEHFRGIADTLSACVEAMRPVAETLAAATAQHAEAMRPVREWAEQQGEDMRPLAEWAGQQADAPRTWDSRSPRQRYRALLVEVWRRARGVSAVTRAALVVACHRTTSALSALVPPLADVHPSHLHPPVGSRLALVLLASTRPIHGPPLPA